MKLFYNIFSFIYPEIAVLLAIIAAIFLCTCKDSKNTEYLWVTSVIFLLSGAVYILSSQFFIGSPIDVLNGMYIIDKFSSLFKLIILFSSILVILSSVKYSEGFFHRNEFFIVLLSAVLGGLFLCSANDFITLFVALETLSLSSILLVGYSKYDTRSNEAALKYLLNSASASAVFLFGVSLIYGLTGSTQFLEIKYLLLEGANFSILSIAILFIVGGLGFKLASAPFHMWSPDVYEGAPTPVTAFLSTVSKAAALAISIRVLFYLFDFSVSSWQPILIILSVLSMLIGNFVALSEIINKASIKRLMAYSSIAQVGYLLIGLALANPSVISASIFYMVIYIIMNLGAFLCIIAFGNESDSDQIMDYSGLFKKRPLLALAFSIFLFNLAGLPIPPAGFIAKFLLFKAGFEAGSFGVLLASLGLITTILSVYYYSYISKIMIVDEPGKAVLEMKAENSSKELNIAIITAIVAIFILSVLGNTIFQHTLNIL